MSKAKSVVITVILALAMAVATFFAAVSFPVANNVKRYNSFLSNIHLGADYAGYAYTTVYPEGVITAEEYNGLVEEYGAEKDGEDPSAAYTKVGGLYVDKEEQPDVEQLKKDVASDADKLNARFGQKGYSSYSVAVEDGVSIKISVPTNFTNAAYNNLDQDSRSESLSAASMSIANLTAYGELTIRTTDTSISLTDADGNSSTYDVVKKGTDKWTETALVDGAKTYSLSEEDVSSWIKGVSSRTVGTTSVITFKFTKEGREGFRQLTTLVASSSSNTLYFFVGDRQVLSFGSCTTAIDESSLSLTSSDAATAQNSAITLNSAAKGGALTVDYQEIESVIAGEATGGNLAALLTLAACLLVFIGLAVLLIVKYKKLGALTSAMAFVLALVEVYALYLLNIQVTFAVVFTCMLLMALFVLSCALVYGEIKKLTSVGRTMQASVKDGYKNLVMTVTDMHIVLVIVAILLAAIGAGEVAACGLISLIGVVASYVLYWFTRFMWYVTSSPEKDKFKFAGLKRVVYEDD